MKKTINIILGLKNNDSCHNMINFFEQSLEQNLDEEFQLGNISHTFSREELDSAIASGLYQACFVLEKMEDQPVGQGAIKQWRKSCPGIHIVLLMGEDRRASAKARGLYDINYYDGMFLESKMRIDVLARLFEYGRTKEDAYAYYDLDNFVPIEPKKKAKKEDSLGDTDNGTAENTSDVNNSANLSDKEKNRDDSLSTDANALKAPNNASSEDIINTKDIVNENEELLADSENNGTNTVNTDIENTNSLSTDDTDDTDNTADTETSGANNDATLTDNIIDADSIDTVVTTDESSDDSVVSTEKAADNDDAPIFTESIVGTHIEETVTTKNESAEDSTVGNVDSTDNTELENALNEQKSQTSHDRVSVENGISLTDTQNNNLEKDDESPEEKKPRTFSDNDDDEGSKGTLKKNIRVSFIKQNVASRKPLKKILASETEAEEYFLKHTENVYKSDSKKAEDNLDEADQVFIATLNAYMDQYEVVLNEAAMGTMKGDDLENHIFDVIDGIIAEADVKSVAYERFLRFVNGYDFLEELIANPEITDIHVIDENHIRVKKNETRFSTNLKFFGEHRYERLCKQLLLRNRERLNCAGITSSFTDSTFSEDYLLQVTVVDKTINSFDKPELLIRKTPKVKKTLKELVGEGRLLTMEASYLIHEINEGSTIVIGGAPSSGKSTLLNALIDYIPKNKCGTIMQHRDELVAGVHPEMIIQHPLVAKKEIDGRGNLVETEGVTIEQLAEDALTKDLDYYILGDIKGKEAISFHKAITAGHAGMACVTALKPMECMSKMVSYIVGYNMDLRKDINQTLSEKVGTIVIMDRWNVAGVYRVLGINEKGTIEIESVLDKDGTKEN